MLLKKGWNLCSCSPPFSPCSVEYVAAVFKIVAVNECGCECELGKLRNIFQ